MRVSGNGETYNMYSHHTIAVPSTTRAPSRGGSNPGGGGGGGARRHVSRGCMRVVYPLLMASGESSAPNRQRGRFFSKLSL